MRQLLLIALLVFLSSCQSALFNYQSGMVVQPERTSLSSGEHSASWASRDLRIDFEYDLKPDRLILQGKIEFADRVQYNFNRFEYFRIAAILLDQSGNVLKIEDLASTQEIAPLSFNKDIHLPANTSSLAFSYRGELRASESDDAYIWNYPIKRK